MNDLPYSAISSFRQYSSPHSYVVGNPELVPETQDEVMLMAGFFNKLTVMAGYIHLSNPVIYMTYVDQEQPDVSYNMPENGKYNSLAVFGVEGNLKPFKWWTVKPMVSLLLQYAKTSRYTVSNQAMWKFSLSNNFPYTRHSSTTASSCVLTSPSGATDAGPSSRHPSTCSPSGTGPRRHAPNSRSYGTSPEERKSTSAATPTAFRITSRLRTKDNIELLDPTH